MHPVQILAEVKSDFKKDGQHYTYDINTNTNYNSIAEKKSNLKGM